jgi:hypothetical protein
MATTGNGVFGPQPGEPDPSGAATAGYTFNDFARAVATKKGWPLTQSNIQWLVNLMTREGSSAANNPMDSTRKTSDSWLLPGNPDGVQQYATFQEGVDAAAATLDGPYYTNIRAAGQAGQLSEWDAAGRLASDLHAWSAGPHAPMSKGYTSVSNEQGDGSRQVTANAKDVAGQSGTQLSGAALTQYIEANYPQYSYLLNDPEVGPILIQAAQNNVTDPNVLEGMLHGTKWWQQTSSTARQYDEQIAHDPASMAQALKNEEDAITLQAAQMGVKVNPAQLTQIATNYLRLGQSPDTVTQVLAALYKYQNGGSTGNAAISAQDLKQYYDEYQVPVSDQTLQKQVQDMISGRATPDSVKAQVAAQAQTLYASNPQLVDYIKQGNTVQQWAEPYKEKAASLLGQSPTSIDLSAPMWSQILKPATDPKTGQSLGQAQSLDQWETKLRTDPTYGYDSSLNAIQSASQLASGLKQTLGYQ